MKADIKDYIKRNIPPVIAEVILIISFLTLPTEKHIYTNTFFYLFLLGFVIGRKDVSIKKWFSKLRSGWLFWKK